jgi:hypothetical protein
MIKLANIVFEKELVNHTKLDYINYFNEPIEYDKLDKSLPTLYVGWSFMKACNPNNEIIQNANILHNKIVGDELYWTYSFDESKLSHVKGVENFAKSVPEFYFHSKYQYISLDPIFFQIKDVDDLMDVLPKKIDVVYKFKNEILYVLFENKIWGVNLNIYNYFQFKIDEICFRINERTNNFNDDIDGNIFNSYYIILPNYIYLKRFLVSLLTK